MYILSNFLNDHSSGLNVTKQFVLSKNLIKNSLLVYEEYMINGVSDYSYIKQTVFVSKFITVGNKTIITIHPVAIIDVDNKIITCRKYGSNLVSYNNSNIWFTTDCDENSICEENANSQHDVCVKLSIVNNVNDVVKRDFICKGVYIEKDGVYLSERIEAGNKEIPDWCITSKNYEINAF